jgi:hypothetical protein
MGHHPRYLWSFRQHLVAGLVLLAVLLAGYGALSTYTVVRSHGRVCYRAGTIGPSGVHTMKACYPRHHEDD